MVASVALNVNRKSGPQFVELLVVIVNHGGGGRLGVVCHELIEVLGGFVWVNRPSNFVGL